MRPCNQCGTPIENNLIVCADCESSNKETGYQPKVSVRPFGPDNQPMNPEPEYSTSLGQIGNVFLLICMATGGLIGFGIGGGVWMIIGFALAALFMSFIFFRMMI